MKLFTGHSFLYLAILARVLLTFWIEVDGLGPRLFYAVFSAPSGFLVTIPS
jgi:hypothetical protein